MEKNTITYNLFWKYLERCAYQGVLSIVYIILARILAPEYFGELAIITVFVAIAQTFVQYGLSTALIQADEIDQTDCINLVVANLGIAVVLYFIVYFFAPAIGQFYGMPTFVTNIRIMAVILFPGAVNSVQNAIIVRNGRYKDLFIASFICAILSGIVGIVAAVLSMGVQALIVQQLSLQFLLCFFMMPIAKISACKPHFSNKFVKMFRFGSKLMLSSFLNVLYSEIQTLVIGKLYSIMSLGYYNQGRNYPYLIIANMNTTLNTVLLPAFSRTSSIKAELKRIMKNAISVGTFVTFPLLLGLCGVANNLVEVLLTSKWNDCVPYMQLFCIIFAFYPLSTINLQAYNAIGRSEIYLYNEIAKKIVGIILLVVFIILWNSPMALVLSLLVASIPSYIIDARKSKACFNYSIKDQLLDFLPNLSVSVVMLFLVLCLNLLPLSALPKLAIQVIFGAGFYFLISKIFKLKGYAYWRTLIFRVLKSKYRKICG